MYQPFPCYPSFSSFFVNQCHRSVTWNLFKKPFFPAIQLLDQTFARDKNPFGVPLLFLMHLCIRLVKVFHVWLVQNCPIYNTYRFVLQELGILLGGCLTVKNQWDQSQEMMGLVLGSFLLFHSIHPLSNDYFFFVVTCGIPRFSFSEFTYIFFSIR